MTLKEISLLVACGDIEAEGLPRDLSGYEKMREVIEECKRER